MYCYFYSISVVFWLFWRQQGEKNDRFHTATMQTLRKGSGSAQVGLSLNLSPSEFDPEAGTETP